MIQSFFIMMMIVDWSVIVCRRSILGILMQMPGYSCSYLYVYENLDDAASANT
ncbi:hypothetical protein SLEP1_g5510 [Rubroshorea leprosula]|uniref:Uncharacterized protein n=1 Tax=Rubroshorea leprosula TaxID=152421 RepID=A0AAV5HS77_9ROSI|nr:hypothetical protein SLEP1_g5510 [Rubroshorea leprosula]